MPRLPALLALLPLLPALLGRAEAHETDQLTFRDQPLVDSLPAANAYMDAALAAVLAESQGERLCGMSTPELRRALGKRIHRRTAGYALLWERGLVGMWGFGEHSAQMERAALQQQAFPEREDIYGEVPGRTSFLLRYAGPASTIRLGEVRLGTDKLQHFLGEGWKYYRESRWGEQPAAARLWGTRTEITYYGLGSTRVFSFADLKANWDGYVFYAGLLADGSVIQRDGGGCPVQVRPWDWSAWVTWEYDELLNPSVFSPAVRRDVEEHLRQDQAAYCAAWIRGVDPQQGALRRQALAAIPGYAEAGAPPRVEPFPLDTLCGP